LSPTLQVGLLDFSRESVFLLLLTLLILRLLLLLPSLIAHIYPAAGAPVWLSRNLKNQEIPKSRNQDLHNFLNPKIRKIPNQEISKSRNPENKKYYYCGTEINYDLRACFLLLTKQWGSLESKCCLLFVDYCALLLHVVVCKRLFVFVVVFVLETTSFPDTV
jgi:hypothetical protein